MHDFPYEIRSILYEDRNKKIVFNNMTDVWDYVQLLQHESEEHRKKGGSFTILNNIFEQLPFFVCVNNILDEDAQKDITRYIYAKDTNTPPYKGSFGDTPHTWIQKYYIIKNALNLRDDIHRRKLEQKRNGNK